MSSVRKAAETVLAMGTFPWVCRQQMTRCCNQSAMINPRCLYVFSEHSEMSQEKKQRTFSIDLFFSKPLNVLFCCEENKGSNWAVDERLHHKLSVAVLMVSNSDPLLSAMVSEEEVAGEQM